MYVTFITNLYPFLGKPGEIDDNLFNRCAQVKKIIWACKASPFDKIRRSFYLSVHQNFAHPDIVLTDDVILVSVRKGRAIFARLDKSLAEYTVASAPFLFLTCVEKAIELIEMPTWALIHLAEKVGAPKYERIGFMINSGRLVGIS